MKIVLFASPGVLGPQVFVSLFRRHIDKIACLVIASGQHAVSPAELVALARQAQVPILRPTYLKDPEFIEKIQAVEPDLIIVASYDKKIPREIISIPKIAAINIHSSFLPEYRGACPEYWAIRDGKHKTGVTIHYLNEEFDAGDIVLQEKISILPTETLGSLLYKLADLAANMANLFLDQIHENIALPGEPQDEGLVTHAPLVTQDDLKINWQLSAEEISNLIRASNPLGGSWTYFRGSHLKIWYAEPYEDDQSPEGDVPGEIISFEEKEKLLAQTGSGVLEICAAQYALHYIIDGWHFAMNAGIQKGEVFGLQQAGV